jgi:hypothetical protein
MKHMRNEFPDYVEEIFEPDPPDGNSAKGNGHATDERHNTSAEAGEAAWPVMPAAAYHGLVGEVVAEIAPHTEADSVASQLLYLASFGSAVGRGPHYQVEATPHFANLFLATIGRTSRARKGTGADWILRIFEIAEPDWAHNCIHSGLSSGEGMIMPIRDPVYSMKKGVEELTDPGVADKRCLFDEREFSQVLRVMRREGNVISRMVRDAWDCREVIGTLTKHDRTKATNAYISIIGHITADELRKLLDQTEMLNGFANRFLLACVRRGKLLPHGGAPSAELIKSLGLKTLQAIEAARTIGRVTMTAEAASFWEQIYPELSKDQPGLLGAITARAEAQTIRLALIYTLLDRSPRIERVHLDAALAVWTFCESSARYIFGDLIGEPLADEILRVLRQIGAGGMNRLDLYGMFFPSHSKDKIGAALVRLLTAGKVRREAQKGSHGLAGERWFAI